MMKNDYRRALIMLRAVHSGLSGHVRLERRTLMGTMQFSLSGLQEGQILQAAMAAKTDAGWKIVHIGTLGRDQRCRAGLNWTFDPRCIEGLPLERYSVLLILQTAPGSCRTVMTGYVNGSVQVDWERVEQAACSCYTDAVRSDEIDPAQSAPPPAASQETAAAVQDSEPDMPAASRETAAVVRASELDTPAVLRETAAAVQDSEPDVPAASRETAAVVQDSEPDTPAVLRETAAAEILPAEDVPASDGGGAAAAGDTGDPLDRPARSAMTALQALGADAEQSWPDGVEPLRQAFAAAQPVFLSVLPDHVFIHTYRTGACGQCAVGLRAEGGRPVSVAWAIPGGFSGEPPEGLEGYIWRDGWWLAVADAESGVYRELAPAEQKLT